jgi:phosphatidylethanolamine-binding protein (PEBP) family uncharacterized protein
MNPNHAYHSLPDDSSEELGSIRDDNEERTIYYRKIRRNVVFTALTVFAVMLSVSILQAHNKTTSTNLSTTTGPPSSLFTLYSSAFVANGSLPNMYTCKNGIGLGVSPPLSWRKLPEGTKELYVTMSKDSGYDWSVYAIPATAMGLPTDNEHADTTISKNGTIAVGISGNTEVWYIDVYPFINTGNYNTKNGYDEPCSSGPGAKWYKFTVYAFGQEVGPVIKKSGLGFKPSVILENMQDYILGQSSMTVTFTLTEEVVLPHITGGLIDYNISFPVLGDSTTPKIIPIENNA